MKACRRAILITVLVMLLGTMPTLAATKYGKIGGRTYYSTESKYKNIRIERSGKSAGSHLGDWMKGNIRLVASFAMGNYAIPFEIVKSIVDDGSVKYHKKSYSSYVFQTRYKTRSIFYYPSKSKKKRCVVLEDEKGIADMFYEFHPVGVGFKKSTYTKKLKSKATVRTKYYNNKQRNLKRCHINANHRSKEVWRLNTEILTETWKKR